MNNSSSFINKGNSMSLKEIKNNFETSGNSWLDALKPIEETIKDVESYVDYAMKNDIEISKLLISACTYRLSSVRTFEEFIIGSINIFKRQLGGDYVCSKKFLSFMDPILMGRIRFGNSTIIAVMFSGIDSKYLTIDRMGWLRLIEFSYLSEIIESWLGLDLLGVTYTKIAVLKFREINLDIVLKLRDILKMSYVRFKVNSKNVSELENEKGLVLKLLCDVDNLDNLNYPQDLIERNPCLSNKIELRKLSADTEEGKLKKMTEGID